MSNSTIRDHLNIRSRFLRSTQLERDFGDSDSLEGYVVTEDVRTHLRRIGRGTKPGSGLRAWRITGDFGSGKSSFALLLANLLGRSLKELPKAIRSARSDLALSSGTKPYLPVLVTGVREPLSVALLRGLHSALVARTGGRSKLRCQVALQGLLTNPSQLEDSQAIATISTAAEELVHRGLFGGLLIIMDELGKFLEYASLHPEKQDVFFLQQLGELCSRSRKSPILTIGLLHQGFSDYAEKLSDAAQREWEKVGGRFEGIAFSQPLTQVATLIAAALQVDHTEALRGFKGDAREAMTSAIDLGLFGGSAARKALTELAPGLYPLHPTVIPVLSKFFRRFGQNERSLFSFLLSSEPHALAEFADQPASRKSVYRLANFYDFAAENFSHRLASQSFRSHWNHIDAVVRSFPDKDGLDAQILKTVGILNVLEGGALHPTKEVVALALGNPDDLDERLNELCHKKHVLFNRGLRRGYSLWPNTSVNLEQAFIEATDQVTALPPLADVVRARLDTRPVVARRHYILTGTMRHFEVRYVTAAELAREQNNLEARFPADGVLAVVLCEKQGDRKKAQAVATLLKDRSELVVAVSPPLESLRGHLLELVRWCWIQHNKVELKDDRLAAQEVERQIQAISASIENWLQQYLNIRASRCDDQGNVLWYHNGHAVRALGEGGSLQEFLSDLCANSLFPSAPLLHNELVNRHSISAAAASARQKLFGLMLEKSDDPLLGLPADKAPPEKSMYLSVLEASNIHRQAGNAWGLRFPEAGAENDPCRVRPALEAIVEQLERHMDARVNLREVWSILRSSPYGVRDGLIPLLILTTLIEHETEVAIYEDGRFRPEVDAQLMQRLVKAPDTFDLQLCRIRGVRKELVSQLAAVVQRDAAAPAHLLSIVRPLCLFVGEELPEYVRNTDNLSSETLALRNAVEKAQEPAHLVFRAIPSALAGKVKKRKLEPALIARKLESALKELQMAFPELQARMAKSVTAAFDQSSKSLKLWRASIAERSELVVLGVTDQDLRAFCLKLQDNETSDHDWLEALGSLLTLRPPSRWRDRDEQVFVGRVRQLAGQFNRVYATCFDKASDAQTSAVRVALTQRSGEERDRVIELSLGQVRDARKLKERVRKLLGPDKKISLSALSQMVWDLLDESA